MKRADLLISAVFFFLGFWVIWQATKLPTFSVFGPGPEFMPNVLGVVMILSSAILFVTAWRKASLSGERVMPGNDAVVRIAIIIVGLFFYTFLIDKLGFRETTFAYCLFMLLTMWRQKWFYSLAVSLVLTVSFSWAFGVALDVPIPEGFLEGILYN